MNQNNYLGICIWWGIYKGKQNFILKKTEQYKIKNLRLLKSLIS